MYSFPLSLLNSSAFNIFKVLQQAHLRLGSQLFLHLKQLFPLEVI